MGLLEGQKVTYGGTGDATTRYIGACASPPEGLVEMGTDPRGAGEALRCI